MKERMSESEQTGNRCATDPLIIYRKNKKKDTLLALEPALKRGRPLLSCRIDAVVDGCEQGLWLLRIVLQAGYPH